MQDRDRVAFQLPGLLGEGRGRAGGCRTRGPAAFGRLDRAEPHAAPRGVAEAVIGLHEAATAYAASKRIGSRGAPREPQSRPSGGRGGNSCVGYCGPLAPPLCYRIVGRTLRESTKPVLELPEHRMKNDHGRKPAMKTT